MDTEASTYMLKIDEVLLKYDLEGNFLYSWGSYGNYPGGVAGVHGMSP